MFGTLNYLTFFVSGILLNITPGQDTIYIVGRSVAQGKKAGILSVLGISTSAICHNLIAALGLAALLKVSPTAFNIIKYLGVVYLVYLGIKTILTNSNLFQDNTINKDKFSDFKIYSQGFLTNFLNPKVVLFFLAFLPQFVNPINNYGAFSFLFLGFTFIITGTIWCLILAVFSSYIFGFLRKGKKTSFILNKACGVLFIGLATNVIFITH